MEMNLDKLKCCSWFKHEENGNGKLAHGNRIDNS